MAENKEHFYFNPDPGDLLPKKCLWMSADDFNSDGEVSRG